MSIEVEQPVSMDTEPTSKAIRKFATMCTGCQYREVVTVCVGYVESVILSKAIRRITEGN